MATENKTLHDFQPEWVKLCDKGFTNYASLNINERVWYNVECLIGAVGNGGLISHYYNSGADHNDDTIQDLISLGFPDVADLLLKINKLFPDHIVPIDIEARNEVISSWPDDGAYDKMLEELDNIFFKIEDEIEKKLVTHIQNKVLPL